MVEKSLNKSLYKLELYSAKVVPMLMAGITLANTVLSYYDVDAPYLSYIGGVSILVIIKFYITSYTYKFCAYHRMFLHYIVISTTLSIYDYTIGIPITDRSMLTLQLVIAGVSLFIILYLKFKVCKPLKE